MGIIRVANAQHAVALNATDVPKPWYEMAETYIVPPKANVEKLFKMVLEDFRTMSNEAQQSVYKTLVINCHGMGEQTQQMSGPEIALGYGLAIGQGIRAGQEKLFAILAPVVDRIIIAACGADAGTRRNQSTAAGGSGAFSLREVARHAQATVTGGVHVQYAQPMSGDYLPKGCMDSWSGTVRTYDASGTQVDGRTGNSSTTG
jgi:hypothetical protein